MNRSTADLTAVIPTYNGLSRGFLDQAIRSVLNQTVLPVRILVIDDGSQDGTGQWLRQAYPLLEVISRPNHGLPATRNFAVSLVNTEYVAFLDDDDVWEAEKTATQMAYLAKHPDVSLLFCGITYIDESGKVLGGRKPAEFGHQFPEILLGNSILPPSTVIFRIDLLRQAGPFDENLTQGEDYEYFIRCARVAKIQALPAALVRYRRHAQQMSGNLSYIDDETLRIIRRHAVEAVPDKLDMIVRFFCYGASCRAIFRRDFTYARRILSQTKGPLRIGEYIRRVIGIVLTGKLKDRFRSWEYRKVLGAHPSGRHSCPPGGRAL